MEWALLVSYLYPLFTRRVCFCVYARARSWYLKFDQTRRWKMVAAWRVAAAEDKRKSESLCSFTVSPCDSVFFFSLLPCFRLLSFSSALLLNQVLQNLIHIWWNCKTKIKNPSLDLNFSEHECLVALPWFGCCCCCCCLLWGPSVLLFRKGKIFQLTYIHIYRWFENGRKFGGEWRRVWRQSREEAQELGDLRRQIWGRCWSAGESWQLFQIGQIV